MLLDRRHPAVMFNWIPLALEQDEAKQLQAELMEVLARRADRVPGLFLTRMISRVAD